MMKEMNHRFGFYLISAIMVLMLIAIHLQVKSLSRDVDSLLEWANTELQESENKINVSSEEVGENEDSDEDLTTRDEAAEGVL